MEVALGGGTGEQPQEGSRFWKKAKQNPFVPAGILGGLSALGYSAYKFRTRAPGTKLSVYLIHTRVAAQTAVVGALTLGVLWSMFNEFVLEDSAKTSSKLDKK